VIRRLLMIAACLALGFAIVAALYWLFLNTPEANLLTLAASVVLILAMVVVGGMTVNMAILIAQRNALRSTVLRSARGLVWFPIALAAVVLIWWDVLTTDAWVSRHSGEISAWFIAQFGWADISWLFTTEAWLSRWLRWAFAPIVALCLLNELLADGAHALVRTRWIRRVLHWRTLGVATLVFVGLYAAPWQLTEWRPELPATTVEVYVAAARLGIAGLAIVVGSAILVMVTSRPGDTAQHSVPSVPTASSVPPLPSTTGTLSTP
jgi:hypothetical protein